MLSEFKDIFTYIYGKSGARLSPLVFVSLMSAISEALMLLQIIPIINLLMGINDAPFASFLEQKVILQMTFAQLLPFSFILCVIISNVCRFFTLKIATNLAMVMGNQLARACFQQHISLKSNFFHIDDSEAISNIILKCNFIVTNAFVTVFQSIPNLFVSIASVGILLIIQPSATIIIGVGLILTYAVIMRAGRTIVKSAAETINDKHEQLMNNLSDALRTKLMITIYNQLDVFDAIFSKVELQVRDAQAKILIYSSSPRYFLEMALLTAVGIFSAIFIYSNSNLTQSAPYVAVLALGSVRLLPLIQNLFNSINMFFSSEAAVRHIRKTLQVEHNVVEKNNKSESGVDKFVFDGQLELKNLSKSYQHKVVFENLNFNILTHEKVCVIGPTGSGKSTFLSLLLAIEDADSGKINTSKVEINRNNRHLFHNNVGYLGQNIFLLNDTVEVNLKFFHGNEIKLEELTDVLLGLKLIGSTDEAKEFLNKKIGENGRLLSGGQRQRLAIARMLLDPRKLMVFDEPTSSLDTETSEKVMGFVFTKLKQSTCIFVTHDMSVLRHFDKVYYCDPKLQNLIVKNCSEY